MTTKQNIIKWVESLPEENIDTAVILLSGKKQSSSKIEGVLGDICTLLAGAAIQCGEFGDAVIHTAEYLSWKGSLRRKGGAE